jgi:hypothetical protein
MNACDYAIFRAKSVLSNLYGATVLHTKQLPSLLQKIPAYIDSSEAKIMQTKRIAMIVLIGIATIVAEGIGIDTHYLAADTPGIKYIQMAHQ